MKKYILILLLPIICQPIFGGDTTIRLYKDFTAGMSYDEVKRKPNVHDATKLEIPTVRLYREVEIFGGQNWGQLFGFYENKLTEVSLLSYNIEQYQPAINTVVNSGFVLVYMESATQWLDCIALYRTQNQEVIFSGIDEFEQNALNHNHLTLLFVEKSILQRYMPQLIDKESPSKFLMAILPENARLVTVVVTALEDPENPLLTLTFSAPSYARSILKEDF